MLKVSSVDKDPSSLQACLILQAKSGLTNRLAFLCISLSGFKARILVSQQDRIIDIMVRLQSVKSEDHGSIFDKGRKFLNSLIYSGRMLGSSRPLFGGYWGSFLGSNEANCSPLYSVEFWKNKINLYEYINFLVRASSLAQCFVNLGHGKFISALLHFAYLFHIPLIYKNLLIFLVHNVFESMRTSKSQEIISKSVKTGINPFSFNLLFNVRRRSEIFLEHLRVFSCYKHWPPFFLSTQIHTVSTAPQNRSLFSQLDCIHAFTYCNMSSITVFLPSTQGRFIIFLGPAQKRSGRSTNALP